MLKIMIIMGLYEYYDPNRHKTECEDPEVNEIFQEAKLCVPSLLISERKLVEITGIWPFEKKKFVDHYTIYHEARAADGSPYMVRVQSSGTGTFEVACAYLYGIINGFNSLSTVLNSSN